MASAGLAAALDKTPPPASISPRPASGDGAIGTAAETGGGGAAPQVLAEVKEAILPWHKSVKLTKAILEAGTPSSKHGVSAKDEASHRSWACTLVCEAGQLLKLPQVSGRRVA